MCGGARATPSHPQTPAADQPPIRHANGTVMKKKVHFFFPSVKTSCHIQERSKEKRYKEVTGRKKRRGKRYCVKTEEVKIEVKNRED